MSEWVLNRLDGEYIVAAFILTRYRTRVCPQAAALYVCGEPESVLSPASRFSVRASVRVRETEPSHVVAFIR
jgi:hypothetical protein